MKTSAQYRVLVVEDDHDFSRHLARALREQGYAVDVANDLKTALEFLETITYHAALVDIMLAGEHDRTDRGGLHVLSRIKDLNEGTRPIVLSGQNEPQLSADTLQEYKAAQYLDKGNIRKQGVRLVTDKMGEVLQAAHVLRYGVRVGRSKTEDIGVLAFLSGGSSDETIWVDQCLRILKPAGGYGGLKQFFEAFCEPFLPMFPALNAATPMTVHASQRCAFGKFWSKNRGCGISLLVRNGDEPSLAAPDPGEVSGEVIGEHRGSHLYGSCHRLPAAKRSDFLASLRR